jgi:hypothetical protein
VRTWLLMGDVRPTFAWTEADFVMSLKAESLFGALGLWLAGDIQNARPLVQCRYCTGWYRERRRGTRFCGSEKCDRERKRTNRQRERAGLALKRAP